MPRVWISNGIPYKPGLYDRHGSRWGAGIWLQTQATLITYPEAAVEEEHILFQCGACGKLESCLAVTLKVPDQVRAFQRCDCGKAMHRIRAGKNIRDFHVSLETKTLKVDIENLLSQKGTGFSVKTVIHVHRLFDRFGSGGVFGRGQSLSSLPWKIQALLS